MIKNKEGSVVYTAEPFSLCILPFHSSPVSFYKYSSSAQFHYILLLKSEK